MGSWMEKVHRLFDPSVKGRTAQHFSLKYPEKPDQTQYDLTVRTELEVPADTPEHRVRVRATESLARVDTALAHLNGDIAPDLTITLGRLKNGLHMDQSVDVTLREFQIPLPEPVKVCLVYIDGTVDSAQVEDSLMLPLMDLARSEDRKTGLGLMERVEAALLPVRRTQPTYSLAKAMGGIVSGQVALLMDTVPGILLVDLRKWPGRNVEAPANEQVVRGPQEGFTETLRVNTALLRRRLQTPDLILEPAQAGRRSRSDICLGYLNGVANSDLLAEVRRRLSYVDTDAVIDSGILEQLIEDAPRGFFPTMTSTMRPDRVAAALSEGRAVLMVDGSPHALIVPTVFGDFFRNPEDYYLKWPYASFLRLIRMFGLMITLLLPGLYISVANYHQEMIPSALLLAIASSREAVPFPAAIEVLFMELAFEVIREGTLRIPTAMGQTVGIVGALILGQAAVEASIVSPILVIVVSLTALGSFTVPDYTLSLSLRIARFLFLMLGASFGLYGIAIGLFALSAHSSALRSFGVPYMAPVGPRLPSSPDTIIRGPIADMEMRPAMLGPADGRRQPDAMSGWSPDSPSKRKD